MDTSARSDNVIKRKGRTLLTDKSARPTRGLPQQLEKIPESSFKKTKTKTPEEQNSLDQKLNSMKQTKNMSTTELQFLKEFRKLEDLEREKGIKFFECIGDPPATEQFVGHVQVLRNNFIENKKDKMRDEDLKRFSTEINSDKVVVPTDIALSTFPKWDVYENDHFAMRKRLVNIFLKVVNKFITRTRAGKRLAKIKKR